MKEEDIDNRIQRVITSVASKKAAMSEWDSERISAEMHRKTALKKWRVYGISAAASVAVICSIGLGLYFNDSLDENEKPNLNYGLKNLGVYSSAPVYRSATADIADIEAMIDDRKYDSAFLSINALLCDTVIDTSLSPERQEYLRSLYKSREYELNWLKIRVLYKLGMTWECVPLLDSYILIEGVHREEAIQLLKILKE